MSPIRYCDQCLQRPAKKKITPKIAEKMRLDPKTKVCLPCFGDLTRIVEGLK